MSQKILECPKREGKRSIPPNLRKILYLIKLHGVQIHDPNCVLDQIKIDLK